MPKRAKKQETTQHQQERLSRTPLEKGIHHGKKAISLTVRVGNYIRNIPIIAHFIRATLRFNDRMGNQFGAAITYFSFLSLIPILMLSFAIAGFILASNPDLLAKLINGIANSISDPTLANTLKNSVDTAIKQRTTVGLTGLAIALYSGVNWVSNLRQAILAQFHPVWMRNQEDNEKIYFKYLRDAISLIGLLLALVITLSLTSIAGSAQATIVKMLGLDGIEWLRPSWFLIGLAISISANYLLFLWLFWVLPRHQPERKALLRGTLMAAIGFEVIKYIMTMTLPRLANSPSGAAFGSVIGLMTFFYLFARLTLFCAAWIATADNNYKNTE
ncbi:MULTISPECIES: inner membrane protein YhjD [Photorhabdus]|uniref:inner membrane protein YhjD n=1 Tax=Photorhabdus TaxID=29487 RepID=UPI000DCE620F|nr:MULTISPECIES: inner membrane protein YhjD [Photorhabdus]MCT8343110.1 inner membrane protein YhjD [Photorhabdus kleinii]RAW96224.1 inner membrane protein YhjD [Photorhabdus sp. S9-53]RAX00158.1 inner membrane protein YhjD [Photorhabdus sp. S10-54]RAX04492.1 inner membrane protein YhjD [Photorhabdus sp. S8-52]